MTENILGKTVAEAMTHIDLQYNGEFETTFHYLADMTLEESIERVLNAVQNQLEIDDCQYDANILSYTAEQLFNELHFFDDFGKKVAVSETAVFFTEADGSEGQYYSRSLHRERGLKFYYYRRVDSRIFLILHNR